MLPATAFVTAAAALALAVAPAIPAPARSAPAVPAAPAASPSPSGDTVGRSWSWPLSPRPGVLRRFDIGPARWSSGHRGVDLDARPGAVVRAPAAGVVHFVGVVAGRPVLSIAHDDGLISSFEPVSSALRPGEQVEAGAAVGTLSALPGHCYPDSCLHWGVRRGEVYLDPLLLVRDRPRPIILKPLAGLS